MLYSHRTLTIGLEAAGENPLQCKTDSVFHLCLARLKVLAWQSQSYGTGAAVLGLQGPRRRPVKGFATVTTLPQFKKEAAGILLSLRSENNAQ